MWGARAPRAPITLTWMQLNGTQINGPEQAASMWASPAESQAGAQGQPGSKAAGNCDAAAGTGQGWGCPRLSLQVQSRRERRGDMGAGKGHQLRSRGDSRQRVPLGEDTAHTQTLTHLKCGLRSPH